LYYNVSHTHDLYTLSLHDALPISGSGKSSVVFDTLATESRRQMTLNYPLYVRHQMPRYERPEADLMQNLSPVVVVEQKPVRGNSDRKSTRLNSSHVKTSYAVFCLK